MEIPPEQNAGRILQVGGSLLLSNSKFYKTYFPQIKPDVFPKCISYESEKLMISLIFYQKLTEALLKQLICKTVMQVPAVNINGDLLTQWFSVICWDTST